MISTLLIRANRHDIEHITSQLGRVSSNKTVKNFGNYTYYCPPSNSINSNIKHLKTEENSNRKHLKTEKNRYLMTHLATYKEEKGTKQMSNPN